MRILVTGSTGFVGKHLVPKLINAKHNIAEITIEPEISQKLYANNTIKISVTDKQELFVKNIEKFNPEIVIHLASFLTSSDDYAVLEKLLNVNIHFFCRVLDALKNCELKLFINTGTFAEYYQGDGKFDPAYLYASTKTASRSFLDYYSKVYNFKQTTVVPYTIYGGIDSQKKIIDIIYESLENEIPADLSAGEQILDFIHVEDVASFYVHLIKHIEQLEQKSTFQLGTGVGTTLQQLAEKLEAKTGKKAYINWGAKAYRPSDIMYAVARGKLLNWSPKVTLEKGIIDYLNRKSTK